MYRHTPLFVQLACLPTDSILDLLKSSWQGLTEIEAQARLDQHGPNEIVHEDAHSELALLRKAVWNPFNLLISSLALIAYVTNDLSATFLMLSMVVLSVTLTFFQELRASRAAEKLRVMVSTHATVIRKAVQESGTEEGVSYHKKEVPISTLVPGDLVHLSAGDVVPGDVRLLSAKHLFVNQATLTGESLPVEKCAENEDAQTKELAELRNICFMGSNVINGSAAAVVIKTGNETYFGSIAKSILSQRIETSFEKGIHRFTFLMLKFMMVLVPAVFLINGFTKGGWSEAFLFAVAVAVGLTPEMLPMIVTVNLAKGALAMSRQKVIVKRLNAIQNFGAMDVLCTDKTGTLTEDEVVYGEAIEPLGDRNDSVLVCAYLNSFFQTGLKNFIDIALIKHFAPRNGSEIVKKYYLLDEIPFDFSRKRMSVYLRHEDEGRSLICKGAVEEILELCTEFRRGPDTLKMDESSKSRCLHTAHTMNDQGFRVIAVASKEMPKDQSECRLADEKALTLRGYIVFSDPPVKATAAQALQSLVKAGVTVKILTGDSERVTKKVAGAVGLSSGTALLGHQIDALGDTELQDACETNTLFAKLTPVHKQRIVRALHDRGHVVGFLGDGINDAPALRAADVAISVHNAVDIAKESADLILLEKSLLVLEAGVIEGRKVFGNIIKYIKMGASSNFGNVFSMLGASALLPFLPLRPVQLLTQNLLYDFSQAGIPLDTVDLEYLEKPRRWEIGDIGRFMICMGPISSLFDYATFALMWFVFKANMPQQQSLFQAGWFVEGLLSQTLIVHMIRTRKIPFIQSRASWPLLLTTTLIMALGIYIPFSRLGASLGFVPLPLGYFPWLIAMLLAYCVLTQVVKNWFIRKYGYN